MQLDHFPSQFSEAVHGYFLSSDSFLTVLRLRSSLSVHYVLINTISPNC